MDGVNMSNTNAALTRGISGFDLKLIAVISMVIDHFAAVVIWGIIQASYRITASMQLSTNFVDQLLVWVAANRELVLGIYETMRLIGRIAFPIYCYLIVEGYKHTKNVAKYALRLGIFAIISEVPFDLALTGRWFSTSYSNVFFTLLIGLLVILGISYVEKFHKWWMERSLDTFLGKLFILGAGAIVVFIGGYVAEVFLCTDYGLAGVVAIVIMYLLRNIPWIGFAAAVLALTVLTSSTEIVALVGLLPLWYYNGKRGRSIKYFFYAFYPVHLLLFWLMTVLIGI